MGMKGPDKCVRVFSCKCVRVQRESERGTEDGLCVCVCVLERERERDTEAATETVVEGGRLMEE